MMESLEHIFDKPTLLRRLKAITRRLVFVSNCNAFAINQPILAFGDTGPMTSVPVLLGMLEREGWRVRHSADVRSQSMETLVHWKQRIDAIYLSARVQAGQLVEKLQVEERAQCGA
jgi:hypothetical protein